MKNRLIVCAATALVASMFASASAADLAGSVPATTLSSMGFGGVEILSDDAGLAVRGKGTYANVWGNSTANYTNRNGSNTSSNGYDAGASHHHGGSSAQGSNLSYAGNAQGYGRHRSFSVNFAGGRSQASAN